MNSKNKQLLIDTFIFALGNIGSKIILFFLVPLYTSCLTQAEYGIADLVFTAAQLIVPFVSCVIFDAVLRFGISKDCAAEDVLICSFLVLGLGSVLAVILTPLVGLYASLKPWRWYLCIYIILYMFSSTIMNYLKVLGKNKAYAVCSILQTLILALSNLVLLKYIKIGVRGYLLSTIAGVTVSFFLSFWAGDVRSALKKGRFDPALLRQMVRFSAPLILNNISWWVIQSSDKFMLEYMIGAAALGLYTAAAKIPALINVIISIFSQAWGISSVKEYEASNDNSFYREVFSTYAVIAFGAAVFLTALTKPFMKIYVSESFFPSWKYVPLLLASASFSAISSYFGSLYGAMKMSMKNMYTTLFSAVLNIVLNYIFIQKVGIWGAVIGTVASYLAIACFRMFDVLRYIRFKPDLPRFFITGALVIVQAVFVSLDLFIWEVSAAAILCFAAVNYSVLKKIVMAVYSFIRRKKA